jgi:preprotein translocase subunit YajC
MKSLLVNEEGKIISGKLRGLTGKVIAFDSEEDEAILKFDDGTFVHISSERIKQNIEKQLTIEDFGI